MTEPTTFDAKVASLHATWNVVRTLDIERLRHDLLGCGSAHTLLVGSGGSLITAMLAAGAVERMTGGTAQAITPLELVVDRERARGSYVWLFSAGGANPDILAAFEVARFAEARRIHIVVNRPESPLAKRAVERTRLHLLLPADPKDGFLATHSFVMNAAALMSAELGSAAVPDWAALSVNGVPVRAWSSGIMETATALFARGLVVLAYDPALKAAAAHLETNLWEAALASVQSVDFRNLAHGRHVLLDRKRREVALIGFVDTTRPALWQSIAALAPTEIPRIAITVDTSRPGGREAALAAVFELTRAAGRAAGIDPGKPGVADFGRAMYALETLERIEGAGAAPPVLRKLAAVRVSGGYPTTLAEWAAHLDRFAQRLGARPFAGLVLDYDGTAVDTSRRGHPPAFKVTSQLIRLLEGGVPMAFATGRGGSIGEELRQVIPTSLWPLVRLGLYNGAAMSGLGDAPRVVPTAADITAFMEAMARHPKLARLVPLTKTQPYQASVTAQEPMTPKGLREEIVRAWDVGELPRLRAFCSGHSVDVLSNGVSKLNVCRSLARALGVDETALLCIGDSGAWPGNDYELLASPLSLSVDNLSPEPDRCWNLLPPSISGPDGLVIYLSACHTLGDGTFRFDPQSL